MSAHTWDEERAAERIARRLAEVKDVQIKDYVRDADLENLPVATAYRVDGVHVYVDILNMAEMLDTTDVEGETCHRRTLRFLNLHYRAVHRILEDVDAIRVDFHNQRLHAVVAKPYDDEADRIHRAVAVAQLIIDVLAETGDEGDEIIPSAEVRVGIDSGVALAVNNGRRGHREPLFLGQPANLAAKLASGGSERGIYLTSSAREKVGLEDTDEALTAEEVEASEEVANLGVTADEIVEEWREDLVENPIARFNFSGHTPPWSDLDLEQLSPAKSRRQDLVSLYGDLDGFTAFVADRISSDYTAKQVVRVLHVLRSELDSVLHRDFGGLKVRFIGDSIHGVLAEGTAQTTDDEETVSTATLCAGGLRSSFELALRRLTEAGMDVGTLGLAVGFELGPVAVTRLGMKGAMIPCAVGRAVLAGEAEQQRCSGTETAIGETAHASANCACQNVFGSERIRTELNYATALAELADDGDKTARASRALASPGRSPRSLLERVSAASSPFAFPDRKVAPTKPAGFA